MKERADIVNVTVVNAGISFDVRPGERILEAAERNGVTLPVGCRAGVCGVCISRVVAGAIHYPDGPPLALFEEEVAAGKGLCCVGATNGNLEIEVVHLGEDFEAWE